VITIAVGLIAAIPTIITGLVDLFGIPADAPARTLGWWHLTLMSSATGMFAGTFRLQLDGYSNGMIITSAVILGVISWVLLAGGGYLGGSSPTSTESGYSSFPAPLWLMRPFPVVPTIPTRSAELGSADRPVDKNVQNHSAPVPSAPTAPVHTGPQFPLW
jgi:uncharacterized membrane protein YvlD (DUF360 family)